MAYEQRDNSGSLFKNSEKTSANPNWADYQGKIMVDGKLHYLSAWMKESAGGVKFMSLATKPVAEQATAVQANTDDLPF
jgi:hypothetical protein